MSPAAAFQLPRADDFNATYVSFVLKAIWNIFIFVASANIIVI